MLTILLAQITFIHVVHIDASDISQVKNKYIYLCIIHIIHIKLYAYIYIHSTKRRMRYHPGKIVICGFKLFVEA